MKTKITLRSTTALLALATLLYQPTTCHAQGTAFTYQGRLNDGANPVGGIYDLRFTIYDAVTNGAPQGVTLTNTATAVSNGLFAVTLDFGNQFPGAARWLEIAVRINGNGGFNTLSPRQPLTSSPYAITAGNLVAGTGLSGTYGNAVTLNNANNNFGGNGGGLTNVNAAKLGGLPLSSFWQTSGNAGTVPGANVLGTTDNQPLEFWVNGTRALKIIPTTNTVNWIGGSGLNVFDVGVVGATIAGGGTADYLGFTRINYVRGNYGSIGGGIGNVASNIFTTVAGGRQNIASGSQATVGGGFANNANGPQATVGGGSINIASTDNATVAGGALNTASGPYATVSGGYGNQASAPGAFVGGGGYDASSFTGNIASNVAATVSGGLGNLASGQYATVVGGYLNTASGDASTAMGFLTTARGDFSTAMGYCSANNDYSTAMGRSDASGNTSTAMGFSTATGDSSTAMGQSTASGYSSTAMGQSTANNDYSTAMGFSTATGNTSTAMGQSTASGTFSTAMGYSTANGYASFAGGNRAFADQNGSFIWCDSLNQDGHSVGANSFTVRASGGVYLFTSAGATGVQVGAGGGSWSSVSDRNVKENFQAVNASEMLARVAAMPLTSWNYKTQAKSIRHIGPMAQDFYAAFNVGEDEKHIATVDADGVALAAIQGLNQKVNLQSADLQEKETEIAELKQRLEALEKIIQNQKSN